MLSAKPRVAFPVCPTPDFVGGYKVGIPGTASETVVSLTSLTGGLASAPAEDDIVIVSYASAYSSDIGMDSTGYTEAVEGFNSNGINYGVWWKKMTSTPDTSVTVSQTGGTLYAGAVAIHVWRGQDLSSPFCATPLTVDHSEALSKPNPPAIYSPYNGAVILCVGASTGFGTVTYTAGYLSNLVQVYQTDSADVAIGLGSVVSTGGSYNPAEWGATNVSYSSAATLALKGA